MFRIDGPTASPGGLFTGGNPAVPTPATIVTPEWLNAIQEEIAAVIIGAGLNLAKGDSDQLLEAIRALISSGGVSFATDAETIFGAAANKAVHPRGAAALVAARIATIVGLPPETLNTIAKMASAIGNNPNFAGETTQALAARALAATQVLVGGAATGGGSLNGDITITVAPASGAEFNAQEAADRVLTPAAYKAGGGGDWQAGWAPLPGGMIEQWGSQVVIGDNTSARQFIVTFPRPFLEGCGSITGNAEPYLTGQGQWHPITVNFTPPTIAGVSGFIDATDSSKRINGAKRLWWRAVGR